MPEDALFFQASLSQGAGFELDAEFSVSPGETLALVGPSGAGKSTCLDVIAGLVHPRTASVRCGKEVWNGVDVFVPPERRRVGLVFQDYALFPHLSAADNVAYGPRVRGRSRAEATATARRWMDRLGLAGAVETPVRSLSGGERQRVALARALASEPRVLLLDEPFVALDVTTRGLVRAELRAFLKECGLPTILVTHDPVDALALGDRVVVLEGGRVTQVGKREELVTEPRTPFVAELAGLNLYRVEVAAGAGLKEACAGPICFHVLADDHQGPAFVSFAPADVSLSDERLPGSARNAFPGRVREIRPLRDRLHVVLDVGVLLVAEVTRESSRSLGLHVDQPLWGTVKATAIRVYD